MKRADSEVPFRDSLLGERVWRLGLEVGEHWKRNRTKHTRNSRAPKGEGLLLKNPGRNLRWTASVDRRVAEDDLDQPSFALLLTVICCVFRAFSLGHHESVDIKGGTDSWSPSDEEQSSEEAELNLRWLC